ncbi:MAG: 4-phosphoerythronate dehydrogenase [Candidatus Latescibacteria bacterium]|nr:4-phosphoerythronate dehydrogenase [Candidatus Latescibacterota bacterium]
MKIIADENIPYAYDAFSNIGEVTLVSGRNIPSLKNVDALVVRSITKVNSQLLDGSSVKFVGTSTIGFDHIDREYLESNNIGFASAPGSNSNSVSEYVVAALLVYAERYGITLEGSSIGVIGVGNVGSKVVKKCEALGMTVLKNDPPLKDQTQDPSFLSLEDVLKADFVTLHVPLTKTGKYSTYHMVNDNFIASMDGVLINSSRGSVVDEKPLIKALGKNIKTAILDVWENEPNINHNLAIQIDGTPHIAGYSFDGKVNGTQMMYDSICSHFGIKPEWDAKDVVPAGTKITCTGNSDEDVLRDAIFQVYDIRKDYETFQKYMAEFDRLRKEYPIRREFPATEVTFDGSESAKRKLTGLGFKVKN